MHSIRAGIKYIKCVRVPDRPRGTSVFSNNSSLSKLSDSSSLSAKTEGEKTSGLIPQKNISRKEIIILSTIEERETLFEYQRYLSTRNESIHFLTVRCNRGQGRRHISQCVIECQSCSNGRVDPQATSKLQHRHNLSCPCPENEKKWSFIQHFLFRIASLLLCT